MTIAMFSLIIFSLVMMATMNANYGGSPDAGAGWDVVAVAQGNVSDEAFAAELSLTGVDQEAFLATGTTTNPSVYSSELRMAGTEDWKLWPVLGADDAYLESSTLRFQSRATGYESDQDVISALLTQPNVAVVDSWVIPTGGLDGGTDSTFQLSGIAAGDATFEPMTIELAGADGAVRPVTIIGIIDEEITSLHAVYLNQRIVDEVYPAVTTTSFFVKLADADAATNVAQSIEAAMLTNGVQAESIHELVRDAEKEEAGFLYLIEGFMALGLLVGVAAIGVIAFRSVVERRQQIGVLRALGFPKSLVSLGFMIETSFVVGLGVLTGTVLGILLAHNMLTGDSWGSPVQNFQVPWGLISVILVSTVVSALGMTWLPSRQAGSISPAEALRYE
jgi:putative ABC transport system permease protein